MCENDVLEGGNKKEKHMQNNFLLKKSAKKNTTQKPIARVPPPQTLNQFGLGAPRRR